MVLKINKKSVNISETTNRTSCYTDILQTHLLHKEYNEIIFLIEIY